MSEILKGINMLTSMDGIPDRQVITKGMSKYDFRPALVEKAGLKSGNFNEIFKALTTTLSTYSAGTLSVMVPVYVDGEITDESRKETPMVELIQRVKNYGKTADYNLITAIADAGFYAEGASSLTVQDDTTVRRSVAIKLLASVGQVSGFMQVVSQMYMQSAGYVDALAYEVRNKTIAGKRTEEKKIFLGDSSVGTGDVNEFDGLWNIISNTNSCGLGGSSSYTSDLNGAKLQLDDIRSAIRNARNRGGNPNLIVCDLATYDDIKALIQSSLRIVNQTQVAWGLTAIEFEGIPIIFSKFLSMTAGTGSGVPSNAKSLFVLDMSVIEMRVALDWSYEEGGKTTDAVKFWVKCYEALVVRAPKFNHVIFDIG